MSRCSANPVPRSASSMRHCDDFDLIAFHREHHRIGEPLHVGAPMLERAREPHVLRRPIGDTFESCHHGCQEACSKPRNPGLIPFGRSRRISLRLCQDAYAKSHLAKRVSSRARTSSQGAPGDPERAAETRRSISSTQARSHSASGCPSTLSRSSVASSSFSSSVRHSAAARMSAAGCMAISVPGQPLISHEQLGPSPLPASRTP